jgi:hypothetical protein
MIPGDTMYLAIPNRSMKDQTGHCRSDRLTSKPDARIWFWAMSRPPAFTGAKNDAMRRFVGSEESGYATPEAL